MDEKSHRLLKRIALVLAIIWVGWTFFDTGLISLDPAAYELDAARKSLEDGHYREALIQYQKAFKADPENLGAQRGIAQALMHLGIEAEQNWSAAAQQQMAGSAQAQAYYQQALLHYNQAIDAEQVKQRTDTRQRILGVAYANRGILRDRMGDYPGALADYSESLRLAPEMVEGPSFLVRFMRNQAEKPPSIVDRARYLQAELAKPESERLLRIPAIDARQRAYSID